MSEQEELAEQLNLMLQKMTMSPHPEPITPPFMEFKRCC